MLVMLDTSPGAELTSVTTKIKMIIVYHTRRMTQRMVMMVMLDISPGAELTSVTTKGSGALGTSCSGFWPGSDNVISKCSSFVYILSIKNSDCNNQNLRGFCQLDHFNFKRL